MCGNTTIPGTPAFSIRGPVVVNRAFPLSLNIPRNPAPVTPEPDGALLVRYLPKVRRESQTLEFDSKTLRLVPLLESQAAERFAIRRRRGLAIPTERLPAYWRDSREQ